MPTITAVTPSARREGSGGGGGGGGGGGRFDIEVDGEDVGALSLDAIERLRVYVGAPADERMLESVASEARALHTYDRALAMLASRPRASRELERLLVKKGEPPEHARAAIERLIGLGLLDDTAFARQFARAKLAVGGLSRRRLQSELARRGVAREVSQAAIDEMLVDEAVDEAAILDQLAARKLHSLRDLAPDVQRRRLYAFLSRRGYEPDDVRASVKRALRGA
ncbi:MAG TPA: regulatory protein RecX [Gemmatimonadaceae bacterium]|jgi:regulatory protein